MVKAQNNIIIPQSSVDSFISKNYSLQKPNSAFARVVPASFKTQVKTYLENKAQNHGQNFNTISQRSSNEALRARIMADLRKAIAKNPELKDASFYISPEALSNASQNQMVTVIVKRNKNNVPTDNESTGDENSFDQSAKRRSIKSRAISKTVKKNIYKQKLDHKIQLACDSLTVLDTRTRNLLATEDFNTVVDDLMSM